MQETLGEPPTVRIIRAAPGDAPQVAPLFDAYRVSYCQPSDPQGALSFITERLERGDSVIFLALVPDPEARRLRSAGFTQLYPSFTSVGMGRTWILNDLFVAEEFRRTGIAKRLMSHATDFARSTGAKSMSLLTAHENEAAKALYAAMGWTRDEVFARFTRKL
jgi:GNAT superfamily N-acetyltransferase